MQISEGAITIKKTWLLAVLALLLAFGGGFGAAWGIFGPDSASPQQPLAASQLSTVGGIDEFFPQSPLITTEQLDPLLNAPEIRIIDLRISYKFTAGHIPFALSLPAPSLVDRDSPVRGALISDDEITRLFSRLGIGKDSYVVLYDDKGSYQASRVFWKLQHFGHRKVRVLDGGFPKWFSEGRRLTQVAAEVEPGVFPVEYAPQHLATASWILEHSSNPNLVILDVRPEAHYNRSHVPGAINLFWKDTRNRNGTLRDLGELQELFNSKGVTRDKTIVTYCQGGEHNAHTYMTLKALGYPDVRSYEEAWPGWSRDGLPVVAGPGPGAFTEGG